MPAELRESEPSVYVSNVQRFCVHDGPGIRTVVFLLGCPLSCRWCQNPEALASRPAVMFNPAKCAGCAACVQACAQQANRLDGEGRIRFDRARCLACGRCVASCYFRARELSARAFSVPALLEELLKDRVVFRNSGGGVTLSGGEPLVHAGFAAELLRGCQRREVHTAVETCGAVPWRSFEKVLPVTDLFLYDLKLIDPGKHERWTGMDNRAILRNASALAEAGKRVVVRVPLVPQVNDDEEEFGAIARFAAGLKGVDELHLLPFHQIGSSKYELVGRQYAMRDAPEESDERVARCRQIAEALGLRVSVGGSGFRHEAEAQGAKRRNTFFYDMD
jgi:pyruvate formate lyase activating enzyme